MAQINSTRPGASPSPSRQGHVDADWERIEKEETTLASNFVRQSGVLAALVMMTGSVLVPLFASKGCRSALTAADCWVWSISAVLALGYFWLRSPTTDASSSYLPLGACKAEPELPRVRNLGLQGRGCPTHAASPTSTDGGRVDFMGCQRLALEEDGTPRAEGSAASPHIGADQSPLHARSPFFSQAAHPFGLSSPSRSLSFPTESPSRRCRPGKRIQAMQAAQAAISVSPLNGQDSPCSPKFLLEALAEADPGGCSPARARGARGAQDASTSPDPRRALLFDAAEKGGETVSFWMDDCPPVPAEDAKAARHGIQEHGLLLPLKELASGSFPRLPAWVYLSALAILAVLLACARAQPEPTGVSKGAAFMSGSNAPNESAAGLAAGAEENLSVAAAVEPFWSTGPWSHCSVGCGSGQKHRNITCVNGEWEDCESIEPHPTLNETCREYSGCQWTTGPWGPCDAECGDGNMHREVLCTNSQIQDCFKVLFTVPSETRRCTDTSKCTWHVDEWGPCDNSCGEGEQRRNVTCANGADQFCEQRSPRPDDARTCVDFEGCAWKASGWSECSNTCGNGTRTREVKCMGKHTEECHKSFGDPPVGEEPCHDASGCRWVTGEWSECSSRCGVGEQNRSVACHTGLEEDCLASTAPRPNGTRQCSDKSGCIWTSDWSECTQTCGTGLRTRGVSCANGAPDACKDSPKKATAFNESCHSVIGCKWIAGPWGVCSNDCGNGEQSREVRCGSGREEDCAQNGAPPRRRRTCRGSQGCGAALASLADSCAAADPTLVLGGVFNALVGWLLGFAGVCELWRQRLLPTRLMGKSLLSPTAVWLSGLAALLSALALQHRIDGTQDAQQAARSGSLFTVGLVGAVPWAASLCGRGARCASGQTWKAQVAWLAASAVLLASCAAAVLCAVRADAGAGGDPGPGTRQLRGGPPA